VENDAQNVKGSASFFACLMESSTLPSTVRSPSAPMVRSKAASQDFLSEVAVLMALNSPYITKIYASCSERLAYVMGEARRRCRGRSTSR
jgi:hypothetical protein